MCVHLHAPPRPRRASCRRYVATEAAGWLAQGLLWAMGFEWQGAEGGFNYWLRLPPAKPAPAPARLPGGRAQQQQRRRAGGGRAAAAGAAPGQQQAQQPQQQAAGAKVGRTASSALAAAAAHLWDLEVNAAITVAGRAAAAMAAQHPHGEPHCFPVSPSRPSSAASSRPASGLGGELPHAAQWDHSHNAQQQRQPAAATQAAAGPPGGGSGGAGPRRRRWYGDSASSVEAALQAPAAAASAAAAAVAPAASAVAAAAAELWALDPPASPRSAAQRAAATGVPIVFLHGVGFGGWLVAGVLALGSGVLAVEAWALGGSVRRLPAWGWLWCVVGVAGVLALVDWACWLS